MKALRFTKMQGAGNDFVIVDQLTGWPVGRLKTIVPKICDRKYGIGADGVLFLERSKKADLFMKIFNADGSEAEMCGNGARCCALFLSLKTRKKTLRIETEAGILSAQIKKNTVKLKMTDPVGLKLGLTVHVGGKAHEVDYLNTGVPHAVVQVPDIEQASVKKLGRLIRRHQAFLPAGTNVDFVQTKGKDKILIRTYERGVEDETLACGTGSVACAIISVLNQPKTGEADAASVHKVSVRTRSGEVLCVYFKISKYNITDVWLEGKARVVFRGEYFI
jgi:diaminopimelate epimerase